MIGIYKITNKLNGKVYIGQSRDIDARWRQHINAKDAALIQKQPPIQNGQSLTKEIKANDY